MKNKPKYLVRPHDFCVWELHKETGLYQPRYKKPIENRQDPYDHWNYDTLVNVHDFFPIKDDEMEYYEKKSDYELAFYSWQRRNDGHGGTKGGTRAEYAYYLERVKRFNETHPNWKEDREKKIKEAQDKRIKETYGNDKK